jgi:RimJ/RimL family protein N-acetyltransferase
VPYEEGNPALEVETLPQAEAMVGTLAREWARRSAFFLGAWRKDDGLLVAQVYIGVVAWAPPEFEIGYFVDVDNEGRGYVTEAVRAAIAFAFDHLGAERLRLSCDETNERSWRVAERCGFTREAHLPETQRHARLPDGRWGGDYLYGLLREEHRRSRA